MVAPRVAVVSGQTALTVIELLETEPAAAAPVVTMTVSVQVASVVWPVTEQAVVAAVGRVWY
jgi:hypothetical protein